MNPLVWTIIENLAVWAVLTVFVIAVIVLAVVIFVNWRP